MPKKRTRKAKKKPGARDGDGRLLRWLAAQEAFRDARYGILLERWETYLTDPKRQEKVDRAFREVLEDILKDLPD